MPSYIQDIPLLLCYVLCILWCSHKKTMTKTSLYCFFGSAMCTLTAWLLIEIPPTWFHLVIAAFCFGWGYIMVKHCYALCTAIAIGGMGLFQTMYSVDWFLYGSNPTGLGKHYETIAAAFHLLIMATYTYGASIRARIGSRASGRGTVV